MAISRWDPFGEMMSLRDAMDRLVRESFVRPDMSGSMRVREFAMEMGETPEGFVIRAYMPGMNPDSIDLSVHGDRLTIRGECQSEQQDDVHKWLVRECPEGTMERTITLPMAVNAEAAQASYEQGVLKVKLPKAESVRPRRIPISGAPTASSDVHISGESTRQDVEPAPNFSGAQPAGEVASATHREDVVTQASDDSFPASDPPAWTADRRVGGKAED